jgi:hypothetical protein
LLRPCFRLALSAASLCLAACSGATGGPDAGEPVDSGARVPDAGASSDAGRDGGISAGDAGLDSGQPPDGGVFQGVLVGGTGPYPGAISGVHYRTPSRAGFTDDAGTFAYAAGETVTFSVADVDFLPAAGAPMLSPWQLVAQGQCVRTPELERLLLLLFSLDADDNPADGTQVVPAGPGGGQRPFSDLTDDAHVMALVDQLIPGRAAFDGGLDAFITQMDDEVWQQTRLDNFPLAWVRSQGVATDGKDFYFSYQYGFDETDLSYNTVQQVGGPLSPPWPAANTALGDNHMGDVDYWDGGIYAGLEDGPKYLHPYIIHYDMNLKPVESFALPVTLMTAGVPWVAVDGANSRLLIGNWDPTPALFFMDLATANPIGTLPLSQTLGHIQGGKVFEGAFYAQVDRDLKYIDKIDLETGTVITLWTYNFSYEIEGGCFLPMPDGSFFHALTVDSTKTGMDFRHFTRMRAPLRKSVCR